MTSFRVSIPQRLPVCRLHMAGSHPDLISNSKLEPLRLWSDSGSEALIGDLFSPAEVILSKVVLERWYTRILQRGRYPTIRSSDGDCLHPFFF